MLARQNTTAGAETVDPAVTACVSDMVDTVVANAGLPDETQEAYARLGRIRDAVVKTMPDIKQNVMLIDMVSKSTGSDSMPGNVTLQIDTAVALLTALKAAVEGQ